MGNNESKLVGFKNSVSGVFCITPAAQETAEEERKASAQPMIRSIRESIKQKDSSIISKPTPPIEKEIIIKCSIEEMTKAFFKDYVIVWHDPNADNKENQQYIAQLKKFCEVFTFTEWEKAKDYIKGTQAVCHVVTSGTNGELLVKEIFEKENVCNIYIFCGNKEFHSNWAKNYQKISCLETDIQSLITQIQQNLLEWYKKASSLNFNLPAFAPIFNDSDKSQMNHLHRYLKVLPKFKIREQAKEDFLNLSKAIYTDPSNQRLLADFESYYNEYQKDQTLKWYTLESFLYKVTNNCLRIATSDSIQYCRLLLKDIEQAIKDQYQAKSKNFNGLLYRGAYLSEQEWLSLKENQDKEIEMHGFLSVSKVKNVALNFMQTDPSKKVFITIILPKGPNEEEQGFAEMEEYSQYPQEKEILFNVRSRFTVLETEDDFEYSETSKCRHLVLLYGAQGFRKFITEKNPVQDISIPNVLCAHCHAKPEGPFYATITKENNFYCKDCIDHGTGPFLCIQNMEKQPLAVKTKGCSLLNSSQSKIPFYGYKCCNCEAKREKLYFVCTDCDGAKAKKWCENCFKGEEASTSCIEAGHSVILETSPYTFWCEKMSENELNHLKFHNDVLDTIGQVEVFQQANMFYQSHEYEKAKECYNLYIQENQAKGILDAKLGHSFHSIGLIYKNQAEYKKALEYYFKSLEIYEAFGKDVLPLVATSLNSIGEVFLSQGEYKKALEYHFKSLDIQKSVFGDNHLHTATSYNNIGLAYKNLGENQKALEYHLKSLEIKISLYGENNIDVALSYNNIGMLYENQGEYNKALQCHLKSMETRKSVYGENHPTVATSLNNLGSAFRNLGEHKTALECHVEALNIHKKVYGDDHPDVALSYNNIGLALQNLGQYAKAVEYYLKCLEIQKAVYGENHPDLATSYNNIGVVCENQGEYEMALNFHLKSLEIKKSVYGENHPKIAASYNNIGQIYTAQGESQKALEYSFKALEIYRAVYGENHPNVATFYNNIGLVYYNQKEHNEALKYFLKSLEITISIYGENHPSLANSFHSIASVYGDLGEYKKALEYHLKSLEIHKAIYGENHPDVASVCDMVGLMYVKQGDLKNALEYYSESLDIRKSVFGENHPETMDSKEMVDQIQAFAPKNQ